MASVKATLHPLIGKPLSVTAIVDIMNKVCKQRFEVVEKLRSKYSWEPEVGLVRELVGVCCTKENLGDGEVLLVYAGALIVHSSAS